MAVTASAMGMDYRNLGQVDSENTGHLDLKRVNPLRVAVDCEPTFAPLRDGATWPNRGVK